ncbi:MAG: GGDEF domain-containing protein [Lachnospiraceae bacterium]|nr:GGDEF domain-containing protein [Lachnospiraceae bacterium]
MEMNDILFDKIIDTVQECVFWKDNDRRFVGVNQSFLDFYGFESADVLIGKTDEDMGWHNDPEPYKQDELRVLAGESTYKVPGKCIIKGEERDIIASKTPIYEDGKIIGLVGSFLDVTDPMRRSRPSEGAQVLYSIDELRKYSYFDKLLDDTGLNDVLDSLTGLITRAYILDYAKSLMVSKTPFTFAIIDLDNFKYINDTYGHAAGDIVLKEVSSALVAYTGDNGLVGRFGGDELILINTKNKNYQQNKHFFERMYMGHKVFRRNIALTDSNPFITGTVGCAVYPSDADNYDDLFIAVDKALYSGKRKGRNCYVIYLASQHKDITHTHIKKRSVYEICREMAVQFDSTPDPVEKLKRLTQTLKRELLVSDMYYVCRNSDLISASTGDVIGQASDIDDLVTDELYNTNDISKIRYLAPVTYKTLIENSFETMVAIRVGIGSDTFGYIMCAEKGSMRIWQEDEFAILFSLARMTAVYLKGSNQDMW